MIGRGVSCATCGAQAPELEEGQRSFVCSYCQKQTFVDAVPAPSAAPPSDEPIAHPTGHAAPFRPERPRWLALVPVVLVIVVMAIVMAKVNRGPASELDECATFTGDAMRATWKGCPSRATREIVCRSTFPMMPGLPEGAAGPGFDSLTCDCVRDGARTWFFDAKTAPPLESRESAERVASASCKMW